MQIKFLTLCLGAAPYFRSKQIQINMKKYCNDCERPVTPIRPGVSIAVILLCLAAGFLFGIIGAGVLLVLYLLVYGLSAPNTCPICKGSDFGDMPEGESAEGEAGA